jgi:hypothetical protein
MILSDFILLSEAEKKTVMLHQGILIAKKANQQFMIFLFQMQAFYVEVFCDKATKETHEFRVFNQINQLDPWLESIPIPDLI